MVKLIDVPVGRLFRSGNVYRRVEMGCSAGGDRRGVYYTRHPDGSCISWCSGDNDTVELLNDDGSSIKDLVEFRNITPGSKFKHDNKTYTKLNDSMYSFDEDLKVRGFFSNDVVEKV